MVRIILNYLIDKGTYMALRYEFGAQNHQFEYAKHYKKSVLHLLTVFNLAACRSSIRRCYSISLRAKQSSVAHRPAAADRGVHLEQAHHWMQLLKSLVICASDPNLMVAVLHSDMARKG